MSLIVETGTADPNAESYASVAAADTRLNGLGVTTWSTITTAQKEQALRRATQYMLQAYRDRWSGIRVSIDQALDWPRYDMMVDGFPVKTAVVPQTVANACIDLAYKAASGDLNVDLAQRVLTSKVGPLETVYDRYSSQQSRYPSIEMALAPYLGSAGASMRLVRA